MARKKFTPTKKVASTMSGPDRSHAKPDGIEVPHDQPEWTKSTPTYPTFRILHPITLRTHASLQSPASGNLEIFEKTGEVVTAIQWPIIVGETVFAQRDDGRFFVTRHLGIDYAEQVSSMVIGNGEGQALPEIQAEPEPEEWIPGPGIHSYQEIATDELAAIVPETEEEEVEPWWRKSS